MKSGLASRKKKKQSREDKKTEVFPVFKSTSSSEINYREGKTWDFFFSAKFGYFHQREHSKSLPLSCTTVMVLLKLERGALLRTSTRGQSCHFCRFSS